MPAPNSFDETLARLRAGDQGAAAEIFHRFTARLIGLARLHLDARVRQKVDPEDVLQSAYRSFFQRHAEGEFDLKDWDGLWSLLTVITLRKCGRWREHFHAACRDVRVEVASPSAENDSNASWQALADEPTPTEAAMLAEAVEGLLQEAEGRDRDIVELALQGYHAREIAEQLDRPRRTVSRVLEQVKQRLQVSPDANG
jgi:RNA polymerase sigma-70 factor (ECF subfamily)